MVVDFVRRAMELPEGTLPLYRAERTAKHYRGPVREQAGVTYDQAKAEVNASIGTGIRDRMSTARRAGLMRLLEDRDSDGTTLSTG